MEILTFLTILTLVITSALHTWTELRLCRRVESLESSQRS